jgi:hypothetical protein
MDAEEAAAMVKGLQATAEAAEHERAKKERMARAMRARATKKAEQAQAPLPVHEPASHVSEARETHRSPPSSERKKPKRKKVSDDEAPRTDEAASSSADASAEPPPQSERGSLRLSGIGSAIGGLFGGESERKKVRLPHRSRLRSIARCRRRVLSEGRCTASRRVGCCELLAGCMRI